MARVLAMTECRIDPSVRHEYLAGIPARVQAAALAGAHFWVFEHAGQGGRFLEFTEGGSDDIVRAASGAESSSGLWREVKGA